MEEKYYVQETIGHQRQMAEFEGTLEECEAYYEDWNLDENGDYHIVPERRYKVDFTR